MAELAGKNTVIKISGTATAMVGEATTEDATKKIYQITNAAKRVLDRTAAIKVQLQGTDGTAEAGTTTTNIRITGHGLVAGDLIINKTHAGSRLVTVKVDNDNVTVGAITGQTAGDTIAVYKTEPIANYTLNRLNGTVTYGTATTRVIAISGDYLPMTTAAYAHNASTSRKSDIAEITAFGATHKKRIPTLKYASGSLSQFDVTDTTYSEALKAGAPVVIEVDETSSAEPTRYWALLESQEVAAAIEGIQDETVTWTSTDTWLRLGV